MLLRRPFWYLRHGQTNWNIANRTQGSTDIPLNATGMQQAREAALLVRGHGIRAVFCSPLRRAIVTAEIVAEALDLPIQMRGDLREAGFGVHEGEVMGAWFAAWVAGEVSPEHGESFAAVQARAAAAINAVLADEGPALIVGHGGFFRTVRAAMGMTADVRTPNGVPLLCRPQGEGWCLDEATPLPLLPEGSG